MFFKGLGGLGENYKQKCVIETSEYEDLWFFDFSSIDRLTSITKRRYRINTPTIQCFTLGYQNSVLHVFLFF